MKNKENYTGLELAVIGMACQVPGAANWSEFWNNLVKGEESIQFFDENDPEFNEEDKKRFHEDNYVKARALMDNREFFDPKFFDYTQNEALLMNPAHKLFHQTVVEALEDAGYTPESVNGKISLYAGAGDDFPWRAWAKLKNREELVDTMTLNFITNKDHIASLIGYKLNFNGPCYTINTACSTSLSSVHLACRSLLMGEANLAVAGGISIMTGREKGYFYEEGSIYSKDGHCRTFDKESSGTVGSEGTGAVVLKRLADAIQDNDHIHAVIKGSSANNDGNRKLGYVAPSIQGQMECIRSAFKIAHVEPESIGYLEAHGTGTRIGDPIEVEALNTAFANINGTHSCALGSVKTNIGHTDTASGVIGLIKAVLALKNETIPPTLHFNEINPEIDLSAGPFYVNNTLKPWVAKNGTPLRAGVSSFGIGGTNAHVILEQAPARKKKASSTAIRSLLISARSDTSLQETKAKLTDFLKKEINIDIDAVAYTLQVGRKHHAFREHLPFKDYEDLIANLKNDAWQKAAWPVEETKVAFLFPGRTEAFVNMGKELYEHNPVFKELMDEGFEHLKAITKKEYKELLYTTEDQTQYLQTPILADPLLVLLEYALGTLLKKAGLTTSYLIGQGTGEIAACAVSGAMSLETALKLAVSRAELLEKENAKTGLKAALTEKEAQNYIDKTIAIAAVNGSQQVVFSGSKSAIAKLKIRLEEDGIPSSLLPKHFPIYTSVKPETRKNLAEECDTYSFANTQEIPVWSSVTGKELKPEEIMNGAYWIDNEIKTSQLFHSVKTLLEKHKHLVLIEIGPGSSLSDALLREFNLFAEGQETLSVLPSQNKSVNTLPHFNNTLVTLWQYGANIQWKLFYKSGTPGRMALPTYAFEKHRYPVQPDNALRMLASEFTENTTDATPNAIQVSGQEETVTEETVSIHLNGNEKASIENQLKEIFMTFLNVENVSMDDNLWDIGVDSLNGMLLLKKIKTQFDVDLPLQNFMSTETVGQIAEYLNETLGIQNEKELETVRTITI
ncbi:beta-ketoacyl synthase N-terminal-like domain-containing protein [Ascidiimonas aurantiaca]|uniref:type I polyketide synthase n=1 Tax=Ascidiimonas aurantiaca TaxID=1685432 RepID=UPI0030EDFB96